MIYKKIKIKILFFCFFISSHLLSSNADYINAGPMVGYSAKREVALWIQTNTQADVKFEYWEVSNPDEIFSTSSILTDKDSGFTGTFIADSVEPGRTYYYRPVINDEIITHNYLLEFQTQSHWEYRTDPPAFSFAAGSCSYINQPEYDRPGKSYGGEYYIFENILEKNPDFMLWLGDNVYFREPDDSKTGVYDRYTHDKSIPELQGLLGSVHHYAIWDDHDYGPNDSDKSFIHKHITLKAFKDFYANPSYGLDGEGITTQFRWSDVDFFLLDNRFFRTSKYITTSKKEILGEKQIDWLINALKYSKSPFKIIAMGGQFLNPVKVYENYSNWEEERQLIIDRITRENISGVIFLTGDRHFSEVTKMPRYGSYDLYDFTVSPLTSHYCDICINEKNNYRIKDSGVFQRNFAIFKVYGKKGNRKLRYAIHDSKGNELWHYDIHEDDLK
tara:strand:+ start:129 stop:1463 length:1335 start_codon:yes stop_codon:yes gene_type:complete